MSIWEKMVGKKREEPNIEEEIGKINQRIVELGRKRKQLLDEVAAREIREGFKGASYEPPERRQIEQLDREVSGLRDKVALLKEKKRHEEEKRVEQLK